MHILALALGGCIKGEPVRYGITEDTGGHITYILGAMTALAQRADVSEAEIVTRRFDRPDLGAAHSLAREEIGPKLTVTRIDSGNRDYLAKEALHADRAPFTKALIDELRGRERLPDVIHAHFADAADVAAQVRAALGIPFIYTAHSLGADKKQSCEQAGAGLESRLAEEDAAIRQADAIVGSSRDECERQLLAYPSAAIERIDRIQPGIAQNQASDDEICSALELVAPFLRHPERPIVLAVARPVRKKNLAALVRAYAEGDLRYRANLVILPGLRESIQSGEAEQREVVSELFDLVDRFDLHGLVALPRQHDSGQVRGLYALARESRGVFVNPALIEPYGLTLLEAAVHGVPVVATRRGGPRDIVDQLSHGELVDPTSPADIARGIDRLLSDQAAWEAASTDGQDGVKALTWSSYAKAFVRVAKRVSRTGRTVVARVRPSELLLCDIDGTLTGCRPSAERLSAYLTQNSAMAFGIATGRTLPEARRILREWDLPVPRVWITSVGTEIWWNESGRARRDVEYALAIADGWDPVAVTDALKSVPGLSLQPQIDQSSVKCSYFYASKAAVANARERLRRLGIDAKLIASHDRFLDVIPATSGKAGAMQHVAKRMGLAMDSVIAAGDSGNDEDMIIASPRAIVVANASEELSLSAAGTGAYMASRDHAAGILEGIAHYQSVVKQPMMAGEVA